MFIENRKNQQTIEELRNQLHVYKTKLEEPARFTSAGARRGRERESESESDPQSRERGAEQGDESLWTESPAHRAHSAHVGHSVDCMGGANGGCMKMRMLLKSGEVVF